MDSDRRTDAQLLAATAHDPRAFAAFYVRHEDRVLAWMLRRTGRADLAADLCAEVFAAALSSAHRFRGSGPPAEAWLFGIARNVLGTSLRRGRVEARARQRLRMAPIELNDEILQRIDELRHDGTVLAALEALSDDQRDAVRARCRGARLRGHRARAALLRAGGAQAREPWARRPMGARGGGAMTPRIPELAHELELAAARRARRRSWTRRPAALALVAALLVATSAGAAVIIARGHVGGEPTRPYGEDAPEANSELPLHYATRPIVLGVAPLAHGRRYELVGYQLRSRFGTNLCLDIHILPDGAGYGCGNDRERTQGTVSGPNSTLVSGATEPEVARVEVRYTTATATGRASAALLHVDGAALAKARVSDPFGFYVAELPGGVLEAVAEAYDASGSTLWEASVLTLPSHAPPRRARPCMAARKARDIRCTAARGSIRPG